MHTVHAAPEEKDGIEYAAIGMIFDTKKYSPWVTESEVTIID